MLTRISKILFIERKSSKKHILSLSKMNADNFELMNNNHKVSPFFIHGVDG